MGAHRLRADLRRPDAAGRPDGRPARAAPRFHGRSPALLRESRSPGLTRSFDIPGAVTVTAALVLLIYAIFKAPDMGWSSLGTIGLFAAAAGLLTVFVLIEARSPAPLLPLRILRMRTLVGGNLAILAVGMAVDGMLFPLTLYSQEILGYSALEFGLVSAVMTIMSVVGAVVGQGMVTRFGLRPVAVPSLLLITLGCLSLIWVSADGSYLNDVLLAMLLFGPGMGGAFVASQIAALTGIEEHESGLASGLVDTSFNIGSALGIALVTTAAVARTKDLVAAGSDQARPRVALTEGYQSAFLISVVFGLFGLVVAVFLLRGRAAGQDADETEKTEGIAPQAEAAFTPRTD